MTRRPDISVMIVAYNQEATVGRAIESVLAQRLGPFTMEIVIADDGSTDRTRVIAEGYARRHPGVVRLLPYTPNRGLVDNYFTALGECRGRYIADCAGDDYWLCPDRLRLQAALLDAREDIVMVHSRFVAVRPSDAPPKAPRCSSAQAEITDGRRLMEPLLAHLSPTPIHLSTTLFRADTAARALAEDEAMVCNAAFGCEDLPLMLALLARGKVAFLPIDALAYSVGGESVSSPRSRRRALNYYKSTLRATIILARHYGIASPRLAAFILRRAAFICRIRLGGLLKS